MRPHFSCLGCLVLVGAVRANAVVVLVNVDQYIRDNLPR